MGIKDNIQQWYRQLPIEEKLKVRNAFIDMLEANHFRVIELQGTTVVSEILLSHPRVQRYLKKEKVILDEVKDISDLKPKHKREIARLEAKLTRRLHAKALKQYFREMVNG